MYSIFAQNNMHELSGSLLNDTKFVLSTLSDSSEIVNSNFEKNKRTPMLAAVMSFAIPGAGQIYNKDYLTAGIFVAVEVAAFVFANKYETKGDDQTKFYKNYANEHWSVAQYARWTYDNAQNLINDGPNPREFSGTDYDNLFLDPDTRTKVNWEVLHKLESEIGWYYSHHLAPFGDQQYYEMIGKYTQFNVGWKSFDEDAPYEKYDPNNIKLVDEFKWYSKERGKANDYYNISRWAVITIVTNHIVSAIEAAWTANKFNRNLKMNVSLEQANIGFIKEYYPQINLSYRF